MKKRLGTLMLFPILAVAQDLTGDWTAVLHYSAQLKDKPVVLHFSQSKNGKLSGNLGGAAPIFLIPLDAIVIHDGQVSYTFSAGSTADMGSATFDPLAGVTVNGSFRGILNRNGTLILLE